MAVKLRLRRLGRTHHPVYQIVAADSRAPRDGKFIEKVGTYDPHKVFDKVYLDHEIALKWLKNGAIPTDTVRSMLSGEGILLKYHLHRKGKTAEEIDIAFQTWVSKRNIKIDDAKANLNKKKQDERNSALTHERKVKEDKAAKIQAKYNPPPPAPEPAPAAEPEAESAGGEE
jgi:small subunit ribosomal protein S16